MSKLIVGVPVCNDKESFIEMIDSLITSTDAYDKNAYDKIVIIESGSTDGCAEFCDGLAEQYKFIEVHHTEKEGPLKAYNRLFDIAKQEESDLLLTQTDVVFPKLYKRDWLAWFKRVSTVEDLGAIIPLNGGGINGPDYIEGFEWVGGWCTYLPYRTIKRGIKFDDKFPNGYGVDVDLTKQIIEAGLRIGKLDYWVDHHMQNERAHDNSPESEKMKQASSKYFREKWKI